MSNPSTHRFELMLPFQLREVLEQSPVAFIPLGTLEWHCEHLPVGLDALTAHGLCLRVAERLGGAVLPPLYFGTGGDHGDYPFTIMMPTAEHIEALLRHALKRVQAFGFKKAVILSGHFPETQLAMIDGLAAETGTEDFKVVAIAVNRIDGLNLGPDHAGIFETTLLHAFHPGLVRMDKLPSLAERPLAAGDVWAEGRHEQNHPIWGVIGPDPRKFDPLSSQQLLQKAIATLARTISEV